MKIGTLLTAAIVSLSAVGGGLAVYVAVTKYQTMDKVSVAQSRLEIVRAVGDIPRYMNPERGFATNILYGPAAVDPKMRAELNEKYRKQTDGARDKMNAIRKDLPGARRRRRRGQRHRCPEREIRRPSRRHRQGDRRPAEARKDAARKIVADNAVFNTAVTALLDEQVRKMAQLDGDAYRQASYANIAWTLRDVGGLNASLHKNLVGSKRVATEAEKMDLSRTQGRNDQILMSLQQLRGNPATPANVAAALEKMNEAYVGRFGQELKTGQGRRHQRQIRARCRYLLRGVAEWPRRDHRGARCLLRQRRADPRRGLFLRALQLPDRACGPDRGRGRERRPRDPMVRRRVCQPIVDLTATMSQLASGDVSGEIPGADRNDEIGAMAAAVGVFKDNKIEADRLTAEQEAENDVKMRRARVLDESHPRLRGQGDRTGRRPVLGLRHDGRHRAVDVVDRVGHQPPGRQSWPPPPNRPRPTCRRSPAPPKN